MIGSGERCSPEFQCQKSDIPKRHARLVGIEYSVTIAILRCGKVSGYLPKSGQRLFQASKSINQSINPGLTTCLLSHTDHNESIS
jgi:hypothetical protein